jgi:hypothetical protein
MSALLLFVGIVIGVAITILAGLAVVHWPEPECEPPRYSAIGAGRAVSSRPVSIYDYLQRRLR